MEKQPLKHCSLAAGQLTRILVVCLTLFIAACGRNSHPNEETPQTQLSTLEALLLASHLTPQTRIYTVAYGSESMKPLASPGDVLMFSSVPFDDLRQGMIVRVFYEEGSYFHSIYEKNFHGGWTTMGYNNPTIDRFVLNSQNYSGEVLVGAIWTSK